MNILQKVFQFFIKIGVLNVKRCNKTLVLDADGTFIPLFTDNRLVQILQENIPCAEARIEWIIDILCNKFHENIELIIIKIRQHNFKKNPDISYDECLDIKINDLIKTGMISSAGAAAFDEMLTTAYILTLPNNIDINILIDNINKYKHTTDYDWWFTPDVNALYLDACAKLDKKLLEILGWEKYAEILIKYALLDDIAYPEMSLLEYIDCKLNKLTDNRVKNHAIWTTYIITKGIFDAYGTLDNYKALRHNIRNQTKWKNIVIWTLSLYGEQLAMLLGIDILQSFDTFKLRNGTILSETTLTHKDEVTSGRFTVYNKKSENGLKRFYQVSQIEPNTCALVDDTAENVRSFKLGYIVNKLLPTNITKFYVGGEYFNYLLDIINCNIPIHQYT